MPWSEATQAKYRRSDDFRHNDLTDAQWRLILSCYPPFSTVQNYFHAWSRSGVLERMLDVLRKAARRLSGRWG